MDPSDGVTKRAQARIGQVLRGKWRIDRLLGAGGMATVYEATHLNIQKRVAVKVLHAELSVNEEVRTRFLREGYVANKVNHPGIVQVLDDDTADDGSVFLVMELLEGSSVGDLLEKNGNHLPLKQVVKIIDQLLDVLSAAHQVGIVHRDIKPDNLFIVQNNTLKVLDFGIARLREISGGHLTLTGAGAMGTPAFMPPEQARGRSEQIDARTDLWAVGATMFTMSSGRLVHEAETVNELLLAAMTKPAPPFLTVLTRYPPALAAIIDRALAYDQASRWPDARTMQAALRQAAATIDIPLGDWSSISGLTPLSSLGAMAPALAQGMPPPINMFAPGAAQAPTQAAPGQSPQWQPPRQSSPEIPPQWQQPPRQSSPEVPPQWQQAPMRQPSSPEIPPQWQPLPRQPSSPEIALPAPTPALTAKHPVMVTAPGLSVGAGRSGASSSKGIIIAAAGVLVLVLGGVGAWAALHKPAGRDTETPQPAASAEASAHPTTTPSVAPTPTVTPDPTVAPTPSVEVAPPGSATPAASASVKPSSGSPKGPSTVGPKKPTQQEILNRRN